MEIGFFEAKNIFNTLPVGYYIGRDVQREFSETSEMSYYNPVEDRLVVSYPTIKNTLSKVSDTDENLKEMLVRNLLYHEVSHAFLTPKTMKPSDIINIFEDERIETILKHFYMNVNFKKSIKLINGGIDENPSDVKVAFYNLVRYRICKNETFLQRVIDIIKKYAELNRNSKYVGDIIIDDKGNYVKDEHGYLKRTCGYNSYMTDINRLYNDFRDWWEEKKRNEESGKGTPDNSSSDDNNDTNSDMSNGSSSNKENEDETEENNTTKTTSVNMSDDNDTEEDTEEENKTSKVSTPSSDTDDTEDDAKSNKDCAGENTEEDNDEEGDSFEDAEFTKEEASDFINAVKAKVTNKNMQREIERILNTANKNTKKNGGAINAYSGVFDPRSVVREDYKYFVQQNRNGHVKAFSKINLNLFIDRSGSFDSNVGTVNCLIASLARLEKTNKDFTFNLVTIGMDVQVVSKRDREFSASGGNRLGNEIWGIYNKMQRSDATNYNIVLFDGDAFSDHYSREKVTAYKNMGAFNHSNTVIISDPDNERQIRMYCKKSKNIITTQYVQELYNNVITALNTLAR